MANITAGEAIKAARDVHTTFDKERHPDPSLLRFLKRYQQRILTAIAALRQDAIVSTDDIDLSTYNFATGHELPAHILVHGADVVYTNTEIDSHPLVRVGFNQRHIRYSAATGYFSRTHLFLNGRSADWTGIATVTVRYFPEGGDLPALSTELDLPGQALDACAGALAHFMASRVRVDNLSAPTLLTEAQEAEEKYIDQITARRQIVTHYPHEDW